MYDFYSSKKHYNYLKENGLGVSYQEVNGIEFQCTESVPKGDSPISSNVWEDLILVATSCSIVRPNELILKTS